MPTAQHDPFWDVKLQEDVQTRALDRAIDDTQRAINLAKRMTALAGAPGFSDMLDAIRDLENYSLNGMLQCKDPNEVFKLQGRVVALRDVRKIMQDNERRVEELDRQLEMLQNQRSSIVQPNKE